MGPMAGAREFLDALRGAYEVIILSDTFYQFARPLMRQLGLPTLFCHSLEVDADGMLVDYRLRMPDQKREAVKRLKELNFKVVAAGDSYNDTAMLGEADRGILFHPPGKRRARVPAVPGDAGLRRIAPRNRQGLSGAASRGVRTARYRMASFAAGPRCADPRKGRRHRRLRERLR